MSAGITTTISHNHTLTHSTPCVCVCVCERESLCLMSSPGSRVAAKVYGHFWKSNKATEPSFPRGRCRRREESFLCCSLSLQSVIIPASKPQPMSHVLYKCHGCSFLLRLLTSCYYEPDYLKSNNLPNKYTGSFHWMGYKLKNLNLIIFLTF